MPYCAASSGSGVPSSTRRTSTFGSAITERLNLFSLRFSSQHLLYAVKRLLISASDSNQSRSGFPS